MSQHYENQHRESYEQYMSRRNREEDLKMGQQVKRLPTMVDILSSNTMDEIAKDILEWHRNNIAEELAGVIYRKSTKTHSEDFAYYMDLLPKLNAVCKYFGVEERGYDYYEEN